MGITSISQTYHYYVQNAKLISNYGKMLDANQLPVERGIRLTEEDHLRREVIQDIMCQFELDPQAISDDYNIDFREHFKDSLPQLKPFEDDNLLVDHGDKITITEEGRMFIRNIAMAFDAYLPREGQRKTDKAPQFSKTV